MIPTLTGLRGFALLLVVLAALAAVDLMPGELGYGLDQIGLMIFVTTSGLLLITRYGTETFDRLAVTEYLQQRANRLIPWYAVFLVLSIGISRWWSEWPYRIESVGDALLAIFLVDAPGPLWIVPALAQCYLLFVLVWWVWSRSDGKLVRPLLTLAGLAVAGEVLAVLGWGPSSGLFLGVVAPYFLAGVAMGLLWSTHVEPLIEARPTWVSIAGTVAFVLACVNLPAVREAHGWNLSSSMVGATWWEPLSAIIVLLLVLTAAAQPLSLAVLATAPLRFLGRHGYVIYLVIPVLLAVLPL